MSYFYLAACGPKGHRSGLLLPSRATALFEHPITRPCPIPNHFELNWGIPVSYPRVPSIEESDKGKSRSLHTIEKEKHRKENTA